ncbi:nicotinate (nicotinamide) nucleotide adenylyltransferase [Pigmentiphaga sp. GD03639]|uniref:Probable nicotinate-nucleotide adenylyltransferase n=1 Tax=Pigmentiphaga daeguensis TaxID=414049 RepID=A0ABN1BL86_9BURK|nr:MULTISPECIES: nicotinate (nicotinamide) nucleotide adenylyltransferase [unclassified Pigmentiphaga]MDH2234813.1 nicotinate (nicotinamide) nucleotide adenylyltransferase [Pigmentiphaga sp. GD03639]
MSASTTPRIGLLGGSFDPIHEAHLTLARTALAHLGAASVQLIPAAAPWQRQPLAATAEQRAQMVALAIAGQPGLALNRIEIDRGGPSYTIDTLRALAGGTGTPVAGDARYVWILGADQLANFCTWNEWQGIVALADLAVAGRPGNEPEPPAALHAELARHGRTLHRLPMPEMAISSSGIRQRLARGESVDGLVPPAVLRYITQHRLYQA